MCIATMQFATLVSQLPRPGAACQISLRSVGSRGVRRGRLRARSAAVARNRQQRGQSPAWGRLGLQSSLSVLCTPATSSSRERWWRRHITHITPRTAGKRDCACPAVAGLSQSLWERQGGSSGVATHTSLSARVPMVAPAALRHALRRGTCAEALAAACGSSRWAAEPAALSGGGGAVRWLSSGPSPFEVRQACHGGLARWGRCKRWCRGHLHVLQEGQTPVAGPSGAAPLLTPTGGRALSAHHALGPQRDQRRGPDA